MFFCSDLPSPLQVSILAWKLIPRKWKETCWKTIPKLKSKKQLHCFTQNETIIFKNQTITIKEQRLSGDEGKWWWSGVVRKGGGDDGKRWRWEVVRKGSGDEGKWWWRGVVRKGGGDDGKWWGREVVTKGSGEEGKWWREVVTMGGGDVVLEAVCVVLCVSWICGCRSHCNGCMNVAWALFWGGSRSTKPCIFQCKVASAGDEKYIACAAVAVWIVSRSIGSSSVFCNEWLFLCA